MLPNQTFAALRQSIFQSARRKILFLPHAIRQMSRPDRMITVRDVRSVIMRGDIIEDYPEDARGHSCLLLGRDTHGRAIHVVCSPNSRFLAIITAYVPEPKEWDAAYRVREKG